MFWIAVDIARTTRRELAEVGRGFGRALRSAIIGTRYPDGYDRVTGAYRGPIATGTGRRRSGGA